MYGYSPTELDELAAGIKVKRTEVALFCLENQISDGNFNNDDKIIYWEYLKWCYNLQRNPISRSQFKRELQLQFKRYTSKGIMYYKFNKQLTVTNEEWEALLHDYFVEQKEKQWLKQRKKAQSKSQRARRKREKKLAKEDRKRKKVK